MRGPKKKVDQAQKKVIKIINVAGTANKTATTSLVRKGELE